MHDSDSLVVVGESDVTQSLLASLERDYDVSVTSAGRAGQMADRLDQRIDCLVVDGSSCSQRLSVGDDKGNDNNEGDDIRERFPNVPIVALCETSEDAVAALDAGVDRYVRWGDKDDDDSVAAELAAVVHHIGRNREETGGNEAETTMVDSALDTLQDVFFVFGLDGRFLQWNSRLTTVTGYSDEEVAQMFPTDFIAQSDVAAVATAIDDAIETGQAQVEAAFLTAGGERIPYEFTGSLIRDGKGEPVALCGTGRDITDRRRRERALEEQTERLETASHINAVIRDVNSALVRASSREEIEQAVCDHLVSDAPYRFAWIGDINLTGVDIEPRAWAGVEDGFLDEQLNGEPRDTEIAAGTAIQEGVVLVSQDIAEDAKGTAWRDAALERGYRSVAAIPLSYRETSYGVLCVYAPRVNAFDETERAVLDELGETIAYAISTAEQRRALVSDTVVELDLTLSSGPLFVTASAELDCTLSLEGLRQGDDGSLAEFMTVDGARPDDIVALAEEQGGTATVVTDYDGAGVLQVTMPGPSLAALVADRGGVLRDASAESGVGSIRIELPQDADVRSVVRGLQRQFATVELSATRERERTSTRGLEFREAFDDALTERQREVLETAYLAGYFEWPRGSTAEEVADTLDVSAPTFHEHLRRIQQKLIDAFFETNPPTAR